MGHIIEEVGQSRMRVYYERQRFLKPHKHDCGWFRYNRGFSTKEKPVVNEWSAWMKVT